LYALLHKGVCKYTWNASGRTLIDYALTNSKLHTLYLVFMCIKEVILDLTIYF